MKFSLLSVFLLFVFCFNSFAQPNYDKSAPAVPDSLLFSYEKTSCRGFCPAYKMQIYKSGYAEFMGLRNSKKSGKHKMFIKKKELSKLMKKFETFDFLKMENEYTSMTTDLPSTIIIYKKESKVKRVVDYDGAPENLKKLERDIERVVDSESWSKIE